jgi:hypothetical protein
MSNVRLQRTLMRIAHALLACLVSLAPSLTFAQWIDRGGKKLPETTSRKSLGDFGVHLVLTSDEKAFRTAWSQAGTPPKLQTTSVVRRGAEIAAMMLFHGCEANGRGICDGIVKFTLQMPDGSVMQAGEGPLWARKPSDRGMILLSDSSAVVGFTKEDKTGEYSVSATVMDRVARKQIEVTAAFKVE